MDIDVKEWVSATKKYGVLCEIFNSIKNLKSSFNIYKKSLNNYESKIDLGDASVEAYHFIANSIWDQGNNIILRSSLLKKELKDYKNDAPSYLIKGLESELKGLEQYCDGDIKHMLDYLVITNFISEE